MPTFAVLGATGNVGQSILNVLLDSPSNTVHAFCRSSKKLYQLSPNLEKSDQVQVFEGQIDDTDTIAKCIKDTQAVFLAVAIKGNQPGTSIAQDTAHAVVSALQSLREQDETLPRLVVLSSSSTEHRLMSAVPKLVLHLLYNANSHIYHDLEEAEKFLRSQDDLVHATFVKPGALSPDARKGHVLDLETAKSPVSFLDLAAGMVEVAQDGTGQYDGKAVAVNSAAQDVAIPYSSGILLARGLLFHYLPWTWQYIGG